MIPHPHRNLVVFSLIMFILSTFGTVRAVGVVPQATTGVLDLLEDERLAELDRLLTLRLDAYRKRPVYETESPLYWTLQQFANADPDYEDKLGEWVEMFPDSYVARMARGNFYQHLGWISRGDRSITGTRPAQIQAMKRYLAKAKADYLAAIEIDPSVSVAYAKLIQLSRGINAHDGFRTYVKKGLRQDPRSVRIRVSVLYSLAPKWGGSVEALDRVVEEARQHTDRNPGLALLEAQRLTILADELRIRGRYDEAHVLYDQAAREHDHWLFKYERGLSHYNNSRFVAAIRDFDEAIEKGATLSSVWRWRAWAKIESGNVDGGLDDFAEALERDRYNPDILRGRAKVFVRQRRWKKALDDLEAALVVGRYDPQIHIQKALIYQTALKKPKKAIAAVAEAEKLDPDNPRVWLSYSLAYNHMMDCRMVASLHRYLSLCEDGADCAAQNRDWALQATRMLVLSAFCPDVYKESANYLRAAKSFF